MTKMTDVEFFDKIREIGLTAELAARGWLVITQGEFERLQSDRLEHVARAQDLIAAEESQRLPFALQPGVYRMNGKCIGYVEDAKHCLLIATGHLNQLRRGVFTTTGFWSWLFRRNRYCAKLTLEQSSVLALLEREITEALMGIKGAEGCL